jgi:hypothetical protein
MLKEFLSGSESDEEICKSVCLTDAREAQDRFDAGQEYGEEGNAKKDETQSLPEGCATLRSTGRVVIRQDTSTSLWRLAHRRHQAPSR